MNHTQIPFVSEKDLLKELENNLEIMFFDSFSKHNHKSLVESSYQITKELSKRKGF